MSTYRAKTGTNQALESLTVLSPQPDPGPAIQPTRRVHSLNGSILDEGEYIELHWSALDDASAYTTLLTVFGLHNATTANVTVYVRNGLFAWVRMNGVAVRPEMGREVTWGDRQSRPLDITILVRDLEAAS